MPFGVTLDPSAPMLKFTPSPSARLPSGVPISLPATTRSAMSVTSSFGRRPLGQPALSPASTPSRFWLAGGVGATGRVPPVLAIEADDHLVDQRVAHARHLYPPAGLHAFTARAVAERADL